MLIRFHVLAAAAALAACGAANAQARLPAVTVTGNPLGADQLVTPSTTLDGTELLLRAQPTLGETLNALPGVSSTYFGPTASRPVLRGLDGDRIRILANGTASGDVSNVSYDHAVAAEPIAVERIEVLRGPAALLYGGNAIGGVVNLIDNRIPREPILGLTGKANASWASGARERNGAVLLESGGERFGLHVDAFARRQDETRVPLALPCTQNGATRIVERICNSQAHSDGGAIGGSLFFDRGYVGASIDTLANRYGAVSEDEVDIDLHSRRYALQGEFRELGWIESLQWHATRTDYDHTENEAGVAGTVFASTGNQLRLQARHQPIGSLHGAFGFQADRGRFSAIGEEAFAPPSRTAQQAVFAYEEWQRGWGKLTFGARAERVTVDALAADRFAPGRRTFHPRSAAAGLLWNTAPGWQLTASLARSDRAPKDYELYADGPHIATGAYEVGDRNLGVERSVHAEAGLEWKDDARSARLQVYQSRFKNYVALMATGDTRGDEDLPEYAYRGVRARFTGLEASGTWPLWRGDRKLDLQWRADTVRAQNLTHGEPLPRIAPARIGATLLHTEGPWGTRVGVTWHARQDRVPAGENPTAGFALWEAALTYRARVERGSALFYLKLDNAADRLAYSATSILTQTAPGRVPLPGRSLRVGVEASF